MRVITGSTSCGRSSTVSTSSVNDNHTIQQDNLDDGKVIFQKRIKYNIINRQIALICNRIFLKFFC